MEINSTTLSDRDISKNKAIGVTEGNVIELDPIKIENTFK